MYIYALLSSSRSCMLIYTSGVHCIIIKLVRAHALERLVVQIGEGLCPVNASSFNLVRAYAL